MRTQLQKLQSPIRWVANLNSSNMLRVLAVGLIVICALQLVIPASVYQVDPNTLNLIRGSSIITILVCSLGLWLQRNQRQALASTLILGSMPVTILATAPMYKWGQPFMLLPLTVPIVLAPLLAPPISALVVGGFIVAILMIANQIDPAVGVLPTTLVSYLNLGFFAMLAGRSIRKHVREVEQKTHELEAANEELSRKNNQVQNAMEQIIAASQTRDNVLAAVGHDLRSPLAAIIGYTDFLRFSLKNKVDAEDRDSLDLIKSNGEYLMALMDDILNSTKLQSGKLILTPEPLPVGGVLEAIVRDYRQAAAAKGLILTLDVKAPHLILMADPIRFTQVMKNLISNGIKYTEQGKVTIEVFEDRADMATIRISDTGEGIPEKDLPTIFEPFSQTDRSRRRYDSTGLGLSIVKHLTEAHGGQVLLESTVGKGTIFTVSWPLAPEEPAAPENDPITEPASVPV